MTNLLPRVITGNGLKVRNFNRISTAMTDPRLYERMIDQFVSEFPSQTATLQQELREGLKEHTTALRQSLDIIRAEHAVQESEEDPAFRARVEQALARARERLRDVRARVQHLSQTDA